MTERERVKNALHFKPVDKVPVRIFFSGVGYYEHGEKLNDLYMNFVSSFEPLERRAIPIIPKENFDKNGNFHAFWEDEWKVKWEGRIFGIAGIPYEHPVKCPEDIALYKAPAAPLLSGESFEAYKKRIESYKAQDKYVMHGCGHLYETLIAVYGDENVLCDMTLNEPEINELADKIIEYDSALLERAIKAGVDSIEFGDDYGSERSLLMSPKTWRSFIKPRLDKLFKPARDIGMDIHFHSCGQISEILEDLREVGVNSIWPQLPAYNMEDLAKRCRDLKMAIEIHTDRANVMTFGTPKDVKELVKREAEIFDVMNGGSFFHVEVDNGFPFENIEALCEAIMEYR